MILRVKKCINKVLIVVVLVLLLAGASNGQRNDICPPQEAILPCRCSSRGVEIQIWCSHSDLPRVLAGVKNVAKVINRPIDELILENNYLPSLPGRAFSPLKVLRLMLRHNGLERLASGWLVDLENSLVEVYIVERELRSVPIDSLFGMRHLEAITIQSENLKRLPDFSGLAKLRYINVESSALIELSSQSFRDLISLESVHIIGSRNLNRLEASLFQDLPKLSHINLSDNGINWMHLRSLVGLPNLRTLEFSGNKITDAGMVGRAIKDLSNLEELRLDHNAISILNEGSFVDLQGLKEIYLNDNAVIEMHHGAFHRIPNLKLVHLENNFIRRVHPESFLQASGSGVETVHLYNNEIDRIEELRSLLDTLPMLKFLDMSNNRLSDIPFGALRGHGTMEQLYLNNNNIRIIERDAFMAMPALRELRLRNNTLSDLLPMPFWNLPGLKGLDLSFNRFRRLDPHLLTGLPSLRRLDMSGNTLSSIDPAAFINTPLLETLNISNNQLNSLHSATFRDLANLFEIDASYNQLPDMLAGLSKAVERINLRSNRLRSLPLPPSSMMELPKLRMLDISGNTIQRIPRSIFKSIPELRVLNVAENQIQIVDDESFIGLDQLERLNLQDNKIAEMHERSTEPLRNLRELNLQGNRLQILVDHIIEASDQLERVDLSRNNLVEISPTAFRNVRSLQMLDISSNNLRELPDSMISLEGLKEIDVSFNQLSSLPPPIVTAWKKLEELRASNNRIPELQTGSFRNLPILQYLDLSSNDLQAIQPGALRSLPELQEVVLADNKLTELADHVFEDLPNLQAVHLQQNELRGIAPNAFYRSPSIVYLNLSTNHFKNMENVGLRSVRNLEVLDLSSNALRKVTSSPLRGLDWLVELKLDDNRICGIKGEPFQTMPRLRVLSMKNNRMSHIPERTFRSLRSNIAILDVDGNPLDCSCEMLWFRAWLQETESHYPGPRCRDGSMLRESRLSRSECINDDGRHNRLPLTNEHGDVFNRKNDFDECELENIESYSNNNNNNNLPPSPEESDYFYDQYVDYPNNDINETFAATSNHSAPINSIPNKIRDDNKIVDFNKNKFNNFGQQPPPPPPPHNNSPFTFFGVPIPSIGNIFGNGRNGKNVAIPPSNGSSRGTGRGQIYKPHDPANNRIHSHEESTESNSDENRKRPPPEHNVFHRPDFQTPFQEPKPESGFAPMIPGTQGGFKPVIGPQNETEKSSETKNSTEWQEYFEEVPIVTERSKSSRPIGSVTRVERPHAPPNGYDEGEEEEEEDEGESEENSKESMTQNSRNVTSTTAPKLIVKDSPVFQSIPDDEEVQISDKYEESELNVSLPKPSTFAPRLETAGSNSFEQVPYIDPFKTSKEVYDGTSNSPSSLSALVAPGAQQGIYRKSTITKVIKEVEEPFAAPVRPEPSADNEFGGSHESATKTSFEPVEEPIRREGMDWYFNTYNASDKYSEYQPGLNRLKSSNSSAGGVLPKVSIAVFILTSIFIVF